MISKILLATSLLLLIIPLSVYAIQGTATVDVNGKSMDVPYDAAGLEVTGVEADLEGVELIFAVNVTASPAILEVTFDRAFFDSKFGDTDDPFLAIADGDMVEVAETETTNESRTLRLELPQGTEEVEIIGTQLGGATLEKPPVVEEPKVTPPVVEEPKVTPPVVEEPKVTPPVVTQPETACGPGTVLKDGVCVLEETCGPGTHLEDGACVLDAPGTSERPSMNQLIYGAGAGFVIAFIIMIFLWLIGKGTRQKATA